MKSLKFLSFFLLGICICTFSCQDDDVAVIDPPVDEPTVHTFTPGPTNQDEVTAIFIEVEEGEIIEFGEGTFSFTNTISMINTNCVTIRGAGREKTILDFSTQTAGSDGLKLTNTNNILIEGLTVRDTEGDGIKVNDSDGVTMIDVGAEWTGEASETNGAYGLYPVTSKNVLLDNCYVRGASDAGIYVGQSEHIHVKNCEVENNVAGIEIENCNFAEVYDCHAHHNTGGILVFDLPGLSIVNGTHCKVYNNTIENNDYKNFAPDGNIVGQVPSGTGIMLLSCKEVEVYDNTITNNNIMGVGIISQLSIDLLTGATVDYIDFKPYPNNIYIHGNTFSRTNELPEEQTMMGNAIALQFPDGDVTDILFDGFADPDGLNLCASVNGDVKVSNLDVPNIFSNVDKDYQEMTCEGNPLSVVEVAVRDCE